MRSRSGLFSWFGAILRVAAVCAALLCLASCGIGQKKKVTVRFWNGFTGPDGRTMLRLVKRFNQENPDVNVLMQRMDWATYYNKLFVAGTGQRAPEMFIIHASRISRFMQADFIRPVDDLVRGSKGIDEKDLAANVWRAVEREGRHYAVPLDVHILGTYYNRKLLKQAGIVDAKGEPAPPADRAGFLAALEKLSKSSSPDKRQVWAYVFTWFETNLYTIMCQFGGKFFTDDYSRCILDNPENVEALQFCTDLIHKYKYVPQPENFESWIGFRQGRVAMVFEGIYMLADLQKQKDLDYGAAPLPQLGKEKVAWADSHTMCLRKDLNGKELEATWRFVKFLSDNSLDWAEGGQIPVRTSQRETERFRKMEPQYQFSRQLPYIRYLPQVPFIFEFQTEYDLALEIALRGTAPPKDALTSATLRINEILERRRAMLARANAGKAAAQERK